MTPEQIEHLKKLVAALAEWQLCMSYNDSYFGEPAGLVKRTSRELTKLLESVERATSPVSQMTDEQQRQVEKCLRDGAIMGSVSDSTVDAVRAILAAAAPHAQTNDAQDAARYRFLKNVDPDAEDPVVMLHVQNDWGNWAYMHLGGDDLDEAINAAMSAESANCQDNEGEKA